MLPTRARRTSSASIPSDNTSAVASSSSSAAVSASPAFARSTMARLIFTAVPSTLRCARPAPARRGPLHRHGRRPSIAHRGDEILELALQRLVAIGPPACHRQSSAPRPAAAPGSHLDIAGGGIDRHVRVALKKTDLAHRSRLMRLAVRLAMHPFLKRTRALAMSTRGVNTGTPTASTRSTSLATTLSIRSRS